MAVELALRIASVLPASAGACVLAWAALTTLRIRDPRLRAAVWAWAIADAVAALAGANTAGLLLLRCVVPADFAERTLGPAAPVVLAGWAAVAAGLVTRRISRAVRASAGARALLALHPAPFGDGRVALPPGDGTPFVAGTLRPVIVVPQSFWARLGPDERAAVLAHEEAHVRRGDAWLALAAGVAADVLWPAFPMRFAIRAFGEAVECAADAAAVRAGASRAALAHALVAASGCRLPAPGGALAFTRRSGVARRLHALTRPSRRAHLALQIAALLLLMPWRPGADAAVLRLEDARDRHAGSVAVGLTWISNPLFARVAAAF